MKIIIIKRKGESEKMEGEMFLEAAAYICAH